MLEPRRFLWIAGFFRWQRVFFTKVHRP
jgi:hypothetical protein